MVGDVVDASEGVDEILNDRGRELDGMRLRGRLLVRLRLCLAPIFEVCDRCNKSGYNAMLIWKIEVRSSRNKRLIAEGESREILREDGVTGNWRPSLLL